MAEILREYTNLLSVDSKKAIDYIKENSKEVDKFFTNASEELILNAKVRFLENYADECNSIKEQVLNLSNTFTSQSAIICNFLIKSKGRMTLEEEQSLESMLISNPTRFSLMYFITQKADEISGLQIKDQLEASYLEFVKNVAEKVLANISPDEKHQLSNFISTDMVRSDTSNKSFSIVQELL